MIEKVLFFFFSKKQGFVRVLFPSKTIPKGAWRNQRIHCLTLLYDCSRGRQVEYRLPHLDLEQYLACVCQQQATAHPESHKQMRLMQGFNDREKIFVKAF